MRALFFVSLGLVVYTYVGYPLVLWVLTRLRSHDVRPRPIEPSVSVVIAARNEADKIRRKIEHTLALDYPRERLEILVASDASDDGTDDIVNEFAGRGRAPGAGARSGRARSTPRGWLWPPPAARSSSSPTPPRSWRRRRCATLMRNFADPSIGAVSTEDQLVDAAGNPTGEGLYVRYEMWVRRLESRFHSLVGLSGSCFAIRKALCSSWPSTLASDFMSALHAARGGYRAITEPAARGRFVAVGSSQAEMRRKTRPRRYRRDRDARGAPWRSPARARRRRRPGSYQGSATASWPGSGSSPASKARALLPHS